LVGRKTNQASFWRNGIVFLESHTTIFFVASKARKPRWFKREQFLFLLKISVFLDEWNGG